MATVIRFARHGSKKRPFFRIVVQDKRFKRDGRFIEKLGTYDPIRGLESLSIAKPRLEYWLGTGAQLSTAVRTKLKAQERGRFVKKTKAVPTPVPPKAEEAKEAPQAASAPEAKEATTEAAASDQPVETETKSES